MKVKVSAKNPEKKQSDRQEKNQDALGTVKVKSGQAIKKGPTRVLRQFNGAKQQSFQWMALGQLDIHM